MPLREGCRRISVEQLREKYSAVIMAYGATSDRMLGLEGETTLKGILPSRRVVDWYNGSLDMDLKEGEFDVRELEKIAIIGNGNIACDMSRMLLKDPSDFRNSDAPMHVIEALQKSKVHSIQMVARRGITQAAFTTKEIRELCSLDGLGVYMIKQEFQDSMTDASKVEKLIRGIGRRTEFLEKNATMIESPEQYLDVVNDKSKRKLILRFLRGPHSFLTDSEGSKCTGIRLSKMRLEGEVEQQRAIPVEGWEEEDPVWSNLECDALIKSIGYKSLKMDGLPFDERKSVIPHEFGCVKDTDGKLLVGLYVAGWIKRGPVGIIDATLRDSMETFRMLKHHIEGDLLPERTTSVDEVRDLLNDGEEQVVDLTGWRRILAEEIKRGIELEKIKEKVLDKGEMLGVAGSPK